MTRPIQNYFLFFSQTQLAIQLPAKQTRAAAQLATQFPAEKLTRVAAQGLSVSFHIGLHRGAYVRTGGRSVGRSDVITKPNFLALMGLPKSLINGAKIGWPPPPPNSWKLNDSPLKIVMWWSIPSLLRPTPPYNFWPVPYKFIHRQDPARPQPLSLTCKTVDSPWIAIMIRWHLCVTLHDVRFYGILFYIYILL